MDFKKTAAMDFASAKEIEADGERRAAIKINLYISRGFLYGSDRPENTDISCVGISVIRRYDEV